MIRYTAGLLILSILIFNSQPQSHPVVPPTAPPIPTPSTSKPLIPNFFTYTANTKNTWLGPPYLTYQNHWTDDYSNFITDLGDVVLLIPELLLDQLMAFLEMIFGPNQTWHRHGKITSRLLTFQKLPQRPYLFTEYTQNLLKHERDFFGQFRESYLNTFAFKEETEPIDHNDLMSEQRKLLWDALKDTYFSKYKFKGKKVRDETFRFTDWSGIDFAVLPPLAASYLWYRGLDKDYSIKDIEFDLHLEPIRYWKSKDDLPMGAGLEVGYEDFPIKLILAAGMLENKPELEFIGIGTSLGVVRRMIAAQE